MRSRFAIVPKMMNHWWETLERPHRMFDQHFGVPMHPENIINAFFNDFEKRFPFYNRLADYEQNENRRGWSEIKEDNGKFHVALDVQQFKPDEINVKIVDNYVVVEGKHEEKHDNHGTIARHFIRKYLIPDKCIPEKEACTLTTDGVLTITAPPKVEENVQERQIKIEHIQKSAIEDNGHHEDEPQKQKASAKQ